MTEVDQRLARRIEKVADRVLAERFISAIEVSEDPTELRFRTADWLMRVEDAKEARNRCGQCGGYPAYHTNIFKDFTYLCRRCWWKINMRRISGVRNTP